MVRLSAALGGVNVAAASGFAAVSGLLSRRGVFNSAATEGSAGGSLNGCGPIDVRDMPGVTQPLGFFDPDGFCTEATEGKIRFYREVELKHCRVAMLAALGYPVAEQFHPLFPDVNVPSFIAFQNTQLQNIWGVVLFLIAIPEVFSVFTFQNPAGGESISLDHEAGDLGFDPLSLKPTSQAEFKTMQTKELNNGRMRGVAIQLRVAILKSSTCKVQSLLTFPT